MILRSPRSTRSPSPPYPSPTHTSTHTRLPFRPFHPFRPARTPFAFPSFLLLSRRRGGEENRKKKGESTPCLAVVTLLLLVVVFRFMKCLYDMPLRGRAVWQAEQKKTVLSFQSVPVRGGEGEGERERGMKRRCIYIRYVNQTTQNNNICSIREYVHSCWHTFISIHLHSATTHTRCPPLLYEQPIKRPIYKQPI